MFTYLQCLHLPLRRKPNMTNTRLLYTISYTNRRKINIVPKCHLQSDHWDRPLIKTGMDFWLVLHPSMVQHIKWFQYLYSPDYTSFKVPKTGEEPGWKTYVRLKATGILLFKHGEWYLDYCDRLSQVGPKYTVGEATTLPIIIPGTWPIVICRVDILGPISETINGNPFVLEMIDRNMKLSRNVPMSQTAPLHTASLCMDN